MRTPFDEELLNLTW